MTDHLSSSTTGWENLFHGVFRNHDSIMLLIEPESGRILDANLAAEKFYGYDSAQFKEINIAEIAVQSPEQTTAARGSARRGERNDFVCAHRLASGEIRAVEAHPSPVTLDGQTVLLTIIHDVTAYKKTEATLLESETRLRAIVESEPECIKILDVEGRLLDMNPAGLRMIEAETFEQVKGKSVLGLVAPEYREAFKALNRRVFADASGELEFEIIGLKGTHRRLETHAVPLRNSAGEIISLLGVTRDITERKKAEEERRMSVEQYSSLFDRMMDGVYRSTHAGKFIDVNPAMVKMFGYSSKEEMQNIDIKQELYFDPEERGSHVLDTGQEETEVYRMKRKDGSEIWVEDHGWYIHDEHGNTSYHEGILRDVTERRRAQALWTKYTEQVHVMYRASRELNASLDKQHIYAAAYNSIREIIPCDTVYVSSFERRTSMISLICGWNNGVQVDISSYPPIPLEPEGKGVQSEVIRTAKPLLLNDFRARLKNVNTVYAFDDDGNRLEGLPEESALPRSALVVPMIVENQVIGAIQVFSDQADAYVESDLNLLNAFASQTAVALINSDLFQRVQQENRERKQAENSLLARTRELETLFAIASYVSYISFVQTETRVMPQIFKELEHAISADTSGIILLESNQTQLNITSASGSLAVHIGYKFNVAEGIGGAILKSRQPYQTDDLSNDPLRIKNLAGMNQLGPAMFAPILSGDHLIGILLTARKKGEPAFADEAVRLIITTSELLGNAINRVRLHAETVRRLDHLQTLRAVDQAIASSLDLRITLNILLKHAIGQLRVDAASVFLLPQDQQTLHYAAAQGFRTHHIERAEVHLNDDFAGCCVMRRERIQVADPAQVSHNPPFARLWAEEGFISYVCVPLVAKGEVKGVLEVYRRAAFTPDNEWLEFLDTLAGQAAISIDNAQMFNNMQSANMELAIAYDATIEGWSRALDLRDRETEGHTQRVTEITLLLAKAMDIGDKDVLHIRRGALLHDIGKMGIPDQILLKKGKLTPKEWKIMRMHPIFAFEMLQPIRYLQQSLDIPYSHHEKWDGSGYPRGLKGELIPLAARIFSVVDVYDALTSSRPYRTAWSKKKTLAYIKERSGTEFDPQVVDAFLKMIESRVK
jgi:PAS domain S-box-containing protein/putative nucleotidyltransferase with HDIG domain